MVLKSSDKQIGKGIIINDFLIPFVFGTQYSMSVAGLDTITSRFNQIYMNRLLINCDELSTLDGSFHQSFDILKKRITDKTAKIEIKGGRSFIYPDYCNYIMCTNNDFTIKIEQGDSRYFILECSPVYKGNFAYFKELSNSFTQDTANHFITYISRLNTGLTDVRNIPMTSLKRSMMIMSLQSPLRFLLDIVNNSTTIRASNIIDFQNPDQGDLCIDELPRDMSHYWICSKNLYNMYQEWCDINNERKLSYQKFGRNITDSIEKKRSNGAKYNLKNITISLD